MTLPTAFGVDPKDRLSHIDLRHGLVTEKRNIAMSPEQMAELKDMLSNEFFKMRSTIDNHGLLIDKLLGAVHVPPVPAPVEHPAPVEPAPPAA